MERVVFILVLALSLQTAMDDENKPEKKPDGKQTEKKDAAPSPPAKPKMQAVGPIEGRITSVELESKAVGIEVTTVYSDGRNLKEHKQTHQLRLADDAKVFWRQMPVELDEKGRPKKSSTKKPVKGPGGLTGFPTETETLRREQQVIAILQQKKETAKPTVKKTKDTEVEDNKPTISAIYIVHEAKR